MNPKFKKIEEPVLIGGKHSVFELLQHQPKQVKQIYVLDKNILNEYSEIIGTNKIKINVVETLPAIRSNDRNVNNQGLVAELKPFDYDDLQVYLSNSKNYKMQSLLMLDKIQDPQNFGALIRSAVQLNMDAIIIQDRNQVKITSAVVKASAGAIWSIPIIQVPNLSNALLQLQKNGFWSYGTNLTKDAQDIRLTEFSDKTVIVLGNEGEGISQKLGEKTDYNIFIPMSNKIDSLNVSVAGGIIMFALATSQKKL